MREKKAERGYHTLTDRLSSLRRIADMACDAQLDGGDKSELLFKI